jgi:hypothetical protein
LAVSYASGIRPGDVDGRRAVCDRLRGGGCGFGDGFDASLPRPGRQLGDPLDGVIGQLDENVGEPGSRIDVIELAGLCRPPNYAEWACFPQDFS